MSKKRTNEERERETAISFVAKKYPNKTIMMQYMESNLFFNL
jgi:hypothetical protein